MSLATPDWENDCRPKCRCDKCCGPNKGRIYTCEAPCAEPNGCDGWRFQFNSETCSCAPGFDGSQYTATYTGTFEDIPGDCIYSFQGGTRGTLTPLAFRNGDVCNPAAGDTGCVSKLDVNLTVTFSSGYYSPFYETIVYVAPSWVAVGQVRNRDGDAGDCCMGSSFFGVSPYARECHSVRAAGPIPNGTSSVNPNFPYRETVVAVTGAYKRSESDPNAYVWLGSNASRVGYSIFASTGHTPIITTSNGEPSNATLCEGTGWILTGEWT